jgi:hypothetical protein
MNPQTVLHKMEDVSNKTPRNNIYFYLFALKVKLIFQILSVPRYKNRCYNITTTRDYLYELLIPRLNIEEMTYWFE